MLNPLGVHGIKCLECKLEICDQGITTRLGEILTDNYTHELHLVRVRGHGVGGNDPAALAELVGTVLSDGILVDQWQQDSHCELVVLLSKILIETSSNEGKTLPTLL